MEPWLVILLIVAALLAIGLVILLGFAAFIGAAFLFAFAIEQGFIGLAAYIACWVFLFPIMLVLCIVIGLVMMFGNKDD